MKKILALVLTVVMATTLFACTNTDQDPDPTGDVIESPDIEEPDTETPDAETPDTETPDGETPDTEEPAGEDETPAANIVDAITVSVPEILDVEITLANALPVYSHGPFVFDPTMTPYTFYLTDGGTVTFSTDVQLAFVDATTYETTYLDVAAGEPVSIEDANGGALYFDDETAGFITIASNTDPTYQAGLEEASLDINALAIS